MIHFPKHLLSSVVEKHSAVMKSSKSALVSPMNVAFFQKPLPFHSSPRECMLEETLASRPCPIFFVRLFQNNICSTLGVFSWLDED